MDQYPFGIGRAVDVEAGLTQIRVHELASELSVSAQQVLSSLEELGQKVRGPSTVIGVSAAAKVRSRFRSTRSDVMFGAGSTPDVSPAAVSAPAVSTPAAAPATVAARPDAVGAQSLFLPPVAPPARGVFASSNAAFANPFALPEPGRAVQPAPRPPAGASVPAAARPTHRVAAQPVETVTAVPAENFDEGWRRRGFDEAAQQTWCSNGVRTQDAELADRCLSAGIAPTDLPRKLSGRTVLQRLRDGESTTSVWARIQESEQQPRRAGTKLTGRFQLS